MASAPGGGSELVFSDTAAAGVRKVPLLRRWRTQERISGSREANSAISKTSSSSDSTTAVSLPSASSESRQLASFECLAACHTATSRSGTASESNSCTPGDHCACHGQRTCTDGGFCDGDIGICYNPPKAGADRLSDDYVCCSGGLTRGSHFGTARDADSIARCSLYCDVTGWCSTFEWDESQELPCYLGVRDTWVKDVQVYGQVCVKISLEAAERDPSPSGHLCDVKTTGKMTWATLPTFARAVSKIGDCSFEGFVCEGDNLVVCVMEDKQAFFWALDGWVCQEMQGASSLSLEAEPTQPPVIESSAVAAVIIALLVFLMFCAACAGLGYFSSRPMAGLEEDKEMEGKNKWMARFIAGSYEAMRPLSPFRQNSPYRGRPAPEKGVFSGVSARPRMVKVAVQPKPEQRSRSLHGQTSSEVILDGQGHAPSLHQLRRESMKDFMQKGQAGVEEGESDMTWHKPPPVVVWAPKRGERLR